MKRTKRFVLILILLIASLACQTLTNFSNGNPIPTLTAEPVALVTPTQVIEDSPPALSWVAFLDKNNIWLVHPDGSDLRQITSNSVSEDAEKFGYSELNLEWSPDGKNLAYTQSGHLYVLDISTFATTLLVEETQGEFDWSQDSRQIIYDGPLVRGEKTFDISNSGLWVVDIENGNKNLILSALESDAFALFRPRWSSDGNYVIFMYPGGIESGGYGVADIATGKLTHILDMGNSTPNGCGWVPHKLIIACVDDGEVGEEIVFVDVDGNVLQKIALPEKMYMSFIGAWSADGSQLAMNYYSGTIAENNFRAGVEILTLDTGHFQPLTTGFTSNWAAGAQWIITWDLNDDGPMLIVNTNTGKFLPFLPGFKAHLQPFGNVTIPESTDENTPQQGIVSTVTPEVSIDLTDTPSLDQSLCDDVSIEVKDTSKGNILQICADGETYEIGPLERGVYAIGPNKKFFVYCTNSGDVYASRFGTPTLDLVGDVKDFSIIVRGEAPQVEFEFFGEHPYTVQISEMIMKQNKTLSIPRYITTPN
jgi:Tol biopolymer transport system component